MADNTQTTSVNYSDIFCQAVENIVNGVTSKLKYDISKECTIIKINNKAQNKYQLSDGSITFEAIANGNVSYNIGDQVMVTIPAGDYNKQISILTKIIGDIDSPAGWVRPMDTLIRCTANLFSEQKSYELVANGIIKDKEILTLSSQSYQGFRKLGLSAEFMTRLDNFSVIKGTYGIKIIINPRTDALECDLSNMDMFGNPYNFTTYFSQEAVFEIPESIETINDIVVYFYQKRDFQDAYGNIIYDDNISTLFVKNIEIYLGYDSANTPEEIVTISSQKLSYASPDDLQHDVTLTWYHTVENNQMNRITQSDLDTKEYAVRWYQYSPGCAEEEKDAYGGDNWRIVNRTMRDEEELINSSLVQHFTMRGTRTIERLKAICFIATHPLINDPAYTVWEQYHSNELKFENKTEDTSGGEDAQEVLKKNLSLKFDDESYGNYYLYDQNNELLDSKESSIKRYLHLCYDGVYIEDTTTPLNITKVVWTYSQTKTMLKVSELEPDTINYEIEYTIKQRVYPEYTNNIISCSVYAEDRLITTLSEVLRFGQKGTSGTGNTFLLEMVNNNAVIVGDEEGLIVEAMLIRDSGKRFYFSEEDAKNITWTLLHANENFRLNDNEPNNNSIEVSEVTSTRITLKYLGNTVPSNNYAILKASYKPSDENSPELIRYLPIPLQRNTKFIGFSHGATQVLYNHQGIPKYSNDAYELQYSNAKVANLNKEHAPEDRWELQETLASLKAGDRMAITFNGIVKTGDRDINIPCFYLNINNEVYGVRYGGNNKNEILNLSNPTFYVEYTPDVEYVAQDKTIYKTFKIIPQTLVLNQSSDNPNPVALKLVKGEGQCLSAAPLYSKKSDSNAIIQDKICVSYQLGSTVVWSQPILIMQTPYDFAMLNEWDGSLTIDEKNGIILSTMLGAGKKNADNTFSGVLIGDIKDGTGLDSADCMTGVYGFDHGVMSYGLKENGSAFFGAAANGRIEIDGQHGIIKSAGWVKNGDTWQLPNGKTGTLIDLTDGLFLMTGSGANIKLTDKNDNPSLSGYIDATAKGLATEFRRTAVYAVTCSTNNNETADADGNIIKQLNLSDFTKQDFFQSDNADNNNAVGAIGITDIEKDGVTIAVTFTYAQAVQNDKIEIKADIGDNTSQVVGYKDKRTGKALYMQLSGGEKRAIYVNNKPTNAVPSLNDSNQVNEASNPYGWSAGSTIYFTYKDNHWEVSDSGSYSKIIQTSDMIKTEVSNIAGTLGSSITQTAGKIRLEVAQKANYVCKCTTGATAELKYIRFSENDYNKLKSLNDNTRSLSEGAVLNITFTSANTSNNTKFQLCKDSDPVDPFMNPIPLNPNVKWEAGETLPFIFDGEKFTMTSISNSVITQTANSITSEVRRTAGYACSYPNQEPTNNIYVVEMLNPVTTLSATDILQAGVTLAVTFNRARTSSGALQLQVKINDTKSTVAKPIYYKGKNTSDYTSGTHFTWELGDTIYFSYDGNHWNIVDSGAYSKITQTADAIKLEVGKTANYSGSCTNAASATQKIIEGLPTSLTSIDKGCTLLINFTYASHSNASNATINQKQLSINNRAYNIKLGTYWESGETVGFIYDGSQFVMTTLSNSTITQLNNSISAKVSATGRNDGGTFSWSLQPNGFYLSNSANATTNPVFKCNADGITIGGKGMIKSSNYRPTEIDANGNKTLGEGMGINLESGKIDARDFELISGTVDITQERLKIDKMLCVDSSKDAGGGSVYLSSYDFVEKASGDGGPGYYFRVAQSNGYYIYFRDFNTGKVLSTSPNVTQPTQYYRLECNASGDLIVEPVPGQAFSGYRVHYFKDANATQEQCVTGGREEIIGYVSQYYGSNKVFNTSNTTKYGGPSSVIVYGGNGRLDLTNNKLVLKHITSDNQTYYIVIGDESAPLIIRNAEGAIVKSFGEYPSS